MNIALIAQDGTKNDLYQLVRENIPFFTGQRITATEKTAELLFPFEFNNIRIVRSGINGGDIQIASLVIAGEIDLVIFLTNVQESFPHWYDAHALVRVCVAENVLLAMNVATAEHLINGEL